MWKCDGLNRLDIARLIMQVDGPVAFATKQNQILIVLLTQIFVCLVVKLAKTG